MFLPTGLPPMAEGLNENVRTRCRIAFTECFNGTLSKGGPGPAKRKKRR
jgi:hypothetical protein